MNEELRLKLESNEFSAMYELVTDILTKTSGGNLHKSPEFSKLFSPFLLCRYISMREDLINYADLLNTINSNSKLTNEQFYKFAYQLIPKQKRDFIKYIKKTGNKNIQKNNNDINNIETKSSIFDI